MQYDKRVDRIGYNDEKHIYEDMTTNENYVSVTTLIGKYKTLFDVEYWSEYKALERLVQDFRKIKYANPDNFMDICRAYADPKVTQKVVKQIRREWDIKKIRAQRRGTAYHKKKEDELRNKAVHKYNEVPHYKGTTNILDEADNAVFPELLVYNKEYQIAGQIDLAVKTGKEIQLLDYKTNKAIKTNNPYQNMLPPIEHLEDCSLIHYYLQLNLYRFIIEEQGYNVTSMLILHVDHAGREEEYIVPRMEKEIKAILNDFKSNNSR